MILFLVGPAFTFILKYRFAPPRSGWRWQRSVWLSNLAMLGVAVLLSAVFGFSAYLRIQLPVITMAAAIGVWLFYVQHQFEGVCWQRQAEWDHYTTAMHGSSFYSLPKILQWFSGNIGFHHIHHLSPRIPNYFLERCHRENTLMREGTTLGLRASLRTIRFRVWDEERRQLVGLGNPWL
jgi:omega-6 fatty acid desaturase (delta-12 desaturase)